MSIRDYIKEQCIDTDTQNILDNGFHSEKEIREWYSARDDMFIIRIYDEYYGIDTLLDMSLEVAEPHA